MPGSWQNAALPVNKFRVCKRISSCIHEKFMNNTSREQDDGKDKVVRSVGDQLYARLKRVAGVTGISVSDLVRLCVNSELPRMGVKYGGDDA